MTTDCMVFWVDYILAPYVDMVRSILGSDLRCVVIVDSCTAHFNGKVEDSFNKIGNIKVIPLPAHSRHLSQILDSSCFASLKKKYSSISGNQGFPSKFTRKLMRIKAAYESSINSEIIRSSWESTGFKMNLLQGEVATYSFCEDFKEFLRAQALHQEPQ